VLRGTVLTVLAFGLVASPVSMAEAGNGYSVRKEQGQGLRWNPCQKEITYKVNVKKAGNKGKERYAIREIKKAFRKSGRATGFKFTYKGKTRKIPSNHRIAKYREDEEIIVAYAVTKERSKYYSDLVGRYPGALAVGGPTYSFLPYDFNGNPRGAVSGRGRVVLNASMTKNMPRGFGYGFKRGNVLLHEIGHVMGLNHVKDSRQLMSPYIGGDTRNGFQWGDQAGLKKVGKNQKCIKGASSFFSGS